MADQTGFTEQYVHTVRTVHTYSTHSTYIQYIHTVHTVHMYSTYVQYIRTVHAYIQRYVLLSCPYVYTQKPATCMYVCNHKHISTYAIAKICTHILYICTHLHMYTRTYVHTYCMIIYKQYEPKKTKRTLNKYTHCADITMEM